MSGNPAVVMRLVASAYAMAEKAGAIVRRVLQSGELGIVEKTGANDLQTLADRLVQQSICASLSKSFPKITIIGEEDLPEEAVKEDLIESGQSEDILQKSCPAEYSALKEEELVVWVDPLDGTKEYTEEAAKCFYLPDQMCHTGSDAQLLGTAIRMVIEGGHLDWERQEQNKWRGRVKEKCLGIKSRLFAADVTKCLYRNPA